MNLVTANGLVTTSQIGNGKPIADLDTQNFAAPDQGPFLIKNDSTSDVELEVIYAQGDDFVATYFHPGWNEDVVREVKTTAATVRLLWGR